MRFFNNLNISSYKGAGLSSSLYGVTIFFSQCLDLVDTYEESFSDFLYMHTHIISRPFDFALAEVYSGGVGSCFLDAYILENKRRMAQFEFMPDRNIRPVHYSHVSNASNVVFVATLRRFELLNSLGLTTLFPYRVPFVASIFFSNFILVFGVAILVAPKFVLFVFFFFFYHCLYLFLVIFKLFFSLVNGLFFL